MESNPYAENRFFQANKNIDTIKNILETGDVKNFIKIVESEALSLHAMMMISSPSFILMKPNTLSVIDKVIKFRNNGSVPVCYTLDAGSNIHLLYPKKYSSYDQANWNIYLEFNGKSYETAVVSQDGSNLEVQTDGLTSGYYIEIHPGIQKVISSNLRIDLSAGTNILNTSYARFYPIVMVSIQRYFYSLKRLR